MRAGPLFSLVDGGVRMHRMEALAAVHLTMFLWWKSRALDLAEGAEAKYGAVEGCDVLCG